MSRRFGVWTFRNLTWPEFCTWIQGKTLKSITSGITDANEEVMEFTDGSVAIVMSNYDGPYGEETPGNGIEPPTVKVHP